MRMAEDAPACAMLWIGSRLTAVERACMRSVIAQDHRLTLYAYDEIAGLPEGVALVDAREVLPRETLIAHRSGSYALFSDRFRFELQRQCKGVWLDADVYLIAPLQIPPGGHLFGWSEPGTINGAVLALPQDSPLIAPVLGLFEAPHVPDWLRWPDRLRGHWRAWCEGRVELGRLPWGVAGPLALTALASRYGLLAAARPIEELSPWNWREAQWIFDPRRSLSEFVRPETKALHLYNYMIADRKEHPAAPGSFMARLHAEGA